MDELKDWLRGSLKSFTIWFNGIVGTLLAAVPILQSSLPDLAAMMPADSYKLLASALVIGNILLRIKTSTGLPDK